MFATKSSNPLYSMDENRHKTNRTQVYFANNINELTLETFTTHNYFPLYLCARVIIKLLI